VTIFSTSCEVVMGARAGAGDRWETEVIAPHFVYALSVVVVVTARKSQTRNAARPQLIPAADTAKEA
jgi:hypothetical protein